jgi:dTDP-4-amino-4,6-dideoxygalactose transaminase
VIPFNRPALVGRERDYINTALESGHLSGNGPFTARCHEWLQTDIGCARALLTHSCTAALEMAALLLNVGAGDEIILPSFAFVSTANAFVLRGATPVFVDVCPDTLNIDPASIDRAITPRTKAIVVLHYAGVGCDMDRIQKIAASHGLAIVEDAAHGILASYRGQPLGGIGQIGALSFHETKNVIAGEGGALLINDARYVERAEILWEKGTNRNQFFRGEVDKYTWVDVGSSYLPGEITAAFLLAQLEQADALTARRQRVWAMYHQALEPLEAAGIIRRPIIPADRRPNGHIYYVLARDLAARTALLAAMRAAAIGAVFHYVPLHSSPAGRRFGRVAGPMTVTVDASDRLVRLPVWADMENAHVEAVLHVVKEWAARQGSPA